ncbi:MAG: SDR family oxidoreductase [bacterium]
MLLNGKVIIITGASRGIGRAAACLLADRGARVILASRDGAALHEVSQGIKSRQGFCLAVTANVQSEGSVRALVTRVVGRFGRIDVLINNAGVCVYGSVAQTSLTDWEKVMGTNLTGVFLCTREVVPVMIRQGAGQIINVASQAGRFGFPNLAAYCASKFGVIGFSESLQRELAPHNIEVSCLCPGYVDTELLKVFPADILKGADVTSPEGVADQLLELVMNPHAEEIRSLSLRKIIRRVFARWIPSGLA